MANVREQIIAAQLQYAEFMADHKQKLKVEEEALLKAAQNLSQLEYLKLESEIEAKRAVRENNIQKIESLQVELEENFHKYIEQLKAMSENAMKTRYEKMKAAYVDRSKNYVKNQTDYARNLAKNHYVLTTADYVISSKGNHWQYDSDKNKVNNLLSQGYGKIGSELHYTSTWWPYDKTYRYYYGLPYHVLFKKKWDEFNNITPRNTRILQNQNFANSRKDKTYGWSRHDLDSIMEAHFLSYPSVSDYLARPEFYPYFVAFAEEVPWANKKQMDTAFKIISKYGSKEYAENTLDYLKSVAEHNTKDNLEFKKEYDVKDLSFAPFKFSNNVPGFTPSDNDPRVNPASRWYFPRPKQGYVYVPGMDYINPSTYIAKERDLRKYRTEYGYYMRDVRRAQRDQKFRNALNSFQTFINPLAGGPMCAVNPNSVACKATKDMVSFSMGAAKVWVAAAVGYLTGGTGASIAGTATAVIQDPNLGLGKGDVGKILVALAEAYAIAQVTDAPVNKALKEVIENQVYSIAKRELGKQTGLDQTLLGRVAVDLTAGAGFGMYKDKNFVDAITGSADKSWRLAVARENPYGAIIVAGVTEIEKNNWSINSSDPMDWFDNVDLKGELSRLRKTIRGKDLAKVIGLTYMTSAGKISEDQALLMVGQEASVRNLERFYNDEPIKPDPELVDYRKKQAEVGRWKKGIQVMQKLSTGVPPTKDDILIISDNVAGPIYDRIKSLGLPTKAEVSLWDIAINDIGLPNVAQYTPDVSFTMPDWMKSKKSDGHVVITNPDEMEQYLGKKFTEDAELTKEDLVKIIVGLFPRNVPLVPVSKEPATPTFNWIDDFGNIKIREPLRFPYDHPMLKVGHIKRKYTQEEINYMAARQGELRKAREKMMNLEKKIQELQTTAGMA